MMDCVVALASASLLTTGLPCSGCHYVHSSGCADPYTVEHMYFKDVNGVMRSKRGSSQVGVGVCVSSSKVSQKAE